tara:strand:+ start:183 stop:386 length:204 start_codon:yes stop_codon:yes gene_type:complete
MKVSELIVRLKLICQRENVSPSKVDILFRRTYDSDVWEINSAHEDLYDEETNNVLTSIVLLNDDMEV